MSSNIYECPNELLLSVMTNDSSTTDRYFKRGINPTAVTQTGLTLVGLAARQGCNDVLRLLLEFCEKNSIRIYETDNHHDLTPDGMSELQWDDEILPNTFDNIENEWTTLFRYYIKIIEKTHQFLNAPSTMVKLDPHILDNHSFAPLHHAAINGRMDCVRTLIEFGCSVNIETSDGYTALHLAGEHLDIIELLLKNNANPNKFSYIRQETPIMIAAKKGNTEWMKLLIAHGANINSLNYTDQSALILSVIHNQYESVKILIENKCRLNEVDSDGFSSISYAIKFKNKAILKLLLENGARLHPITNSLQKYLRNGSIDIVKILIEAGVNPNTRSNEMWTPLHVAIKYCDYDTIEYLVQVCHAKLGQSLYNDFKEIHLLMTRKFDYMNFINIFYLLIENHVNFNERTEHFNKTPLEIALSSKNFHAFCFLILQGCNVNCLPAPDTIDYLHRNNFNELIRLVLLSGYKKFPFKKPLTLQQLSRIKIRQIFIKRIRLDQKSNLLIRPSGTMSSYLERYVSKLYLPSSIKNYLYKFPDIDLEYESNFWLKNPVETYNFSLRID